MAIYLFKNPLTGEITEHASNIARSDPNTNVRLEFVGVKEIVSVAKEPDGGPEIKKKPLRQKRNASG